MRARWDLSRAQEQITGRQRREGSRVDVYMLARERASQMKLAECPRSEGGVGGRGRMDASFHSKTLA